MVGHGQPKTSIARCFVACIGFEPMSITRKGDYPKNVLFSIYILFINYKKRAFPARRTDQDFVVACNGFEPLSPH